MPNVISLDTLLIISPGAQLRQEASTRYFFDQSGTVTEKTPGLMERFKAKLFGDSIEIAVVTARRATETFRFRLTDDASQQSFETEVAVSASIPASREAIARVAKNVCRPIIGEDGTSKTGVSAHTRYSLRRLLDTLRDEEGSLLGSMLKQEEWVKSKLKSAVEQLGLEVSALKCTPVSRHSGSDVSHDIATLKGFATDSTSQILLTAEIMLEKSDNPDHKLAYFLCDRPSMPPVGSAAATTAPMGPDTSVLGEAVRISNEYLLAHRVPLQTFRSDFAAIEAALKAHLTLTMGKFYGRKLVALQLRPASREFDVVTDTSDTWMFTKDYPIAGAGRSVRIEHTVTTKLVDAAAYERAGRPGIRVEIEKKIETDTAEKLRHMMYADVVLMFFDRDAIGEQTLKGYLQPLVSGFAKRLGHEVANLVVVSHNLPEASLFRGRELTLPKETYALQQPNLAPELGLKTRVRVTNPGNLKPHLGGGIDLAQIISDKIRDLFRRKMSEVTPDAYYKSDIPHARGGGEVTLRERLRREISEELAEEFGAELSALEFDRGKDEIYQRYNETAHRSVVHKVTTELASVNQSGAYKPLDINLTFLIQQPDFKNFNVFQSHAARMTLDQQIEGVKTIITQTLENTFTGKQLYEDWLGEAFFKKKEALRSGLIKFVAEQSGLLIEIPTNMFYTKEVERSTPPAVSAISRYNEALDKLTSREAKLLGTVAESAAERTALKSELQAIQEQIAEVEARISSQKSRAITQMVGTTPEEKKAHELRLVQQEVTPAPKEAS